MGMKTQRCAWSQELIHHLNKGQYMVEEYLAEEWEALASRGGELWQGSTVLKARLADLSCNGLVSLAHSNHLTLLVSIGNVPCRWLQSHHHPWVPSPRGLG